MRVKLCHSAFASSASAIADCFAGLWMARQLEFLRATSPKLGTERSLLEPGGHAVKQQSASVRTGAARRLRRDAWRRAVQGLCPGLLSDSDANKDQRRQAAEVGPRANRGSE